MSSSTFTSDDLSIGLDAIYPFLQQNQTTRTNGERTSRWLNENITMTSSEDSNYFSMTAAPVVDGFMTPAMEPSSSTSTISTTDTSSTDFSSIVYDCSIENGLYREFDAMTPTSMSTSGYKFMNDQPLFPPLYDNSNRESNTNYNSATADSDAIMIPPVSSVSYSQGIVSSTSQFLGENNPSLDLGMKLQALLGSSEICQKQFMYPMSVASIYQAFCSVDQTMWYQEQEEEHQQQTSIGNSTFPTYHVARPEGQASNSQKSLLTSNNTDPYDRSSLRVTNNGEKKKFNSLHQYLVPQKTLQSHAFESDHRFDTDASHNTVAATQVLKDISNNDDTTNIGNSVALRRQPRQTLGKNQCRRRRRRRRPHDGCTDNHFFRSCNRPLPTLVTIPPVTSCSKTSNMCDICNKTFSRSRDVDRHKRSAHNASHRPYICPLCGKNFTRNDSLLRHKKTQHHSD